MPQQAISQELSGLERVETEHSRWVGFTSFAFVVLQSMCTAVIAISGVRVVIGLSSLAAASGLHRAAVGFHGDTIRIPMMVIAILGSVINLYVIWRIRSLRSRSSSQWRAQPISSKQKRSELFQVMLAVITLLLAGAEWWTHQIVHGV